MRYCTQLCPPLCNPTDCNPAGFPGASDGKSICLQCGRPRFDPWVRKIPWRRKWQPTPVFLPGEFHGWRNPVGYSPWGWKESDTTERLHFHFHFQNRNRLRPIVAKVEGGVGEGKIGSLGLANANYWYYIGWINNKILQLSTGNYKQHPITNYKWKRMYICMSHFAI